jgi:CHAT domain-containing protein
VLRVGAEASEAYLKAADLDDYSILHLAAHAVVDEGKPERSAVLLAAGSEREDGLLQVREIARLELRDRVVVLSACSSASGETIAGEGPLGLARAFFAAGARTVVASLWPLRDDEAAALAEDLARHLGRGSSVGAALAAARRDRIAAGATPAAWAGLVVIGDGNLVPLPRGRARWTTPPVALTALATLLAAALSMMAALLVRRARRRRKPDEAEIRGGSFP